MRKVNWTKVPKNTALTSNSVWQRCSGKDEHFVIKVDIGQLEELFCREEVIKKPCDNGKEPVKPTAVSP